jgi:hypothetical protein
MNNLLRKALRKLKQIYLRIRPTKAPTKLAPLMTLTFTEGARKQVQLMMDQSESRSPEELIRKSLRMYDALITHAADGGKLILQYKDGTSKIIDPISFKEETDEES